MNCVFKPTEYREGIGVYEVVYYKRAGITGPKSPKITRLIEVPLTYTTKDPIYNYILMRLMDYDNLEVVIETITPIKHIWKQNPIVDDWEKL